MLRQGILSALSHLTPSLHKLGSDISNGVFRLRDGSKKKGPGHKDKKRAKRKAQKNARKVNRKKR